MSEITSISIKINLDININGTSEIIPLTSSMIYIPPEIPTKPFFSFIPETNPKAGKKEEYVPTVPDVPLEMYPRIPIRDVKLPVHLLRALKYKEIVQFFFNKEVFAKRMQKWNYSTSQGYSIPGMKELNEVGDFLLSETETEIAQRLLSQKEIENIQVEKQNIELMMHLLFPTYMFYSEGYKTSMQYWNTAEPYLKNSFPRTLYSYLRYKNVLYTITNAVWLNDVFNMPFYQELVFYYDKYSTWKSEMIYHLKLVLDKMGEKKVAENEESMGNKSSDRNTSNNSPKITRKALETVIDLLNKRIMDKNEYEDIFVRNSELSEVYNKHIKGMMSNQGSDNDKPTYFYNMIFSIDKRNSYSNSRLNEMVYFFENIEMNKKGKNVNQTLLGTMLNNILDYTKNKGVLGYLKRGICKTVDKSKCRPRTELSTFYYPGIMYNSKVKNAEPMYEIYMLIDVIEGEVNSKNYSKVKCKYENQSIGKKLEFLTRQWPIWDLSNRRIYMKLNSENVLMKKSVSSSSKERGNYSVSQNQNRFQNRFQNSDYNNNNANNNSSSPFYRAQQTVRNLIEFDGNQTDELFLKALDEFKTELEKFTGNYLTNVNRTIINWKLNTNNTETFLKWLQDNNKYPPPPTVRETNTKYIEVDNKIFTFLENIESIQQKNTNNINDKKNQLRDIQNRIIAEISIITGKIAVNANIFKDYNNNNTYDSLKYVNCILEFYIKFLGFLKDKYLENKIRAMQGGGEGVVENILMPPSMLVPLPKYMATKTRKLWLDMDAGSVVSSAKKGTVKRRVR